MKRKINPYYSKEALDTMFGGEKKRKRIECIILIVCIIGITLLMLPR